MVSNVHKDNKTPIDGARTEISLKRKTYPPQVCQLDIINLMDILRIENVYQIFESLIQISRPLWMI